MAESASTIITDALQEILVQAAEQPIESDEMQIGIRFLNRLMAEWDSMGYSLGFTVITNPSDDVTVPDGALSAIVSNLAIRLASVFDEPVSQSLALAARNGMKTIAKIAVTIEPMEYPDILPVGSGNEWESNPDHFYSGEDPALLTETNGNILLESDT